MFSNNSNIYREWERDLRKKKIEVHLASTDAELTSKLLSVTQRENRILKDDLTALLFTKQNIVATKSSPELNKAQERYATTLELISQGIEFIFYLESKCNIRELNSDEVRVITLLVKGRTNQEIADEIPRQTINKVNGTTEKLKHLFADHGENIKALKTWLKNQIEAYEMSG